MKINIPETAVELEIGGRTYVIEDAIALFIAGADEEEKNGRDAGLDKLYGLLRQELPDLPADMTMGQVYAIAQGLSRAYEEFQKKINDSLSLPTGTSSTPASSTAEPPQCSQPECPGAKQSTSTPNGSQMATSRPSDSAG